MAQDLEKLGLRDTSSPFDWGISYFPNVIDAIDKEFIGFLDYDNLSQDMLNRSHYREDKYNFYFYHDFNKYDSFEKQWENVKEKYWRRINRFLKLIKSPTLFIRYISSEELDENGRSVELNWIEHNYNYISNVLKRYNEKNEIIFIGDESLHSDLIKIYPVFKDKNDTVSRLPIYNNSELYPILSSVQFPGKKENLKRYELKSCKKRSLITKCKNNA